MTFLTTRYQLTRDLTTKDLEELSRLSTLYGVRRLSIEGRCLVIEYDASRLHEAEVLEAVRKAGISAAPLEAIPPGGFDHAGEFKDFAWPVKGISPANQTRK